MGRKRLLTKTGIQRAKTSVKKKKALPEGLDSIIEQIVNDGAEKFRDELLGLSGKEFVDRYSGLLEYIKPKLSRVEKVGDDDNSITINMVSTANDNWKMALPSKEEDEVIQIGE